jgi:putative hemolysin
MIAVTVRPEGSAGYTVWCQSVVGIPLQLAAYRPHFTDKREVTMQECRAAAHAHKQGVLDGLRIAHNTLESVSPSG